MYLLSSLVYLTGTLPKGKNIVLAFSHKLCDFFATQYRFIKHSHICNFLPAIHQLYSVVKRMFVYVIKVNWWLLGLPFLTSSLIMTTSNQLFIHSLIHSWRRGWRKLKAFKAFLLTSRPSKLNYRVLLNDPYVVNLYAMQCGHLTSVHLKAQRLNSK